MFTQTFNGITHTTHTVKQLYETVGAELIPERTKKGVINSIVFGLKMLFGTMDSDDAKYYNEKISAIDNNQHRIDVYKRQVSMLWVHCCL